MEMPVNRWKKIISHFTSSLKVKFFVNPKNIVWSHSELRRRSWISLIAIIVVVVSIFAFYVYNSLLLSQGINDIFSEESILTMDNPHYLSKSFYYQDNNDKITKIFLEDANLWYGYTNISFTKGEDNFIGVNASIVKATVRNDYSLSEIIQFSEPGTNRINFWLDVYLYDEEGNVVDTMQQGNPFKGSIQLLLKSGETATVNFVFAYPKRNIDHFEIYVSYFPNIEI
jgi:hypothetical protein